MSQYGVPETTTAEYPATIPGIPVSTGFATTTSTQIVQDPLAESTSQFGIPIATNDYQNIFPSNKFMLINKKFRHKAKFPPLESPDKIIFSGVKPNSSSQ